MKPIYITYIGIAIFAIFMYLLVIFEEKREKRKRKVK